MADLVLCTILCDVLVQIPLVSQLVGARDSANHLLTGELGHLLRRNVTPNHLDFWVVFALRWRTMPDRPLLEQPLNEGRVVPLLSDLVLL